MLRTLSKRHRGEDGYALLLAIFLVTLVLVIVIAASPNILTEGKREKEKEMIWRGKQYARGVKLYYRKMGRFPTSLDDLTKPKVGSLRFMRQAYKDPMNKEDGSWRFIYVGAAGQLIGSLKPPQQSLQFPQAGSVGTPANALNGPGAPTQQPSPNSPQGQPGSQPGGTTSGTNPPGTTGTPVSSDQSGSGSNPQQGPLADTPILSESAARSTSLPSSSTRKLKIIVSLNLSGIPRRIMSESDSRACRLERASARFRVRPLLANSLGRIPITRRKILNSLHRILSNSSNRSFY
jgi:hypothetical protein